MTTCEWIYAQTLLIDLALDDAHTPEEREFVTKRLRELQGRVRFEERMLARLGRESQPDVEGNPLKPWA
jgi:hypothetical protein